MNLLFEAGRLTSYFAGLIMMAIALAYFWQQWKAAYQRYGIPRGLGSFKTFLSFAFWPKQETRLVFMESLQRRSFAAGICALGAFTVPLLYDFNMLLDERANNPVLAILAVYGLLGIQVSLIRTMSVKPNMATWNFVAFYLFSVLIVLANHAGWV